MVPCFLANPVWSSASASPWLGLWPPQVCVPGLPNSYREYPGAALTLPAVPYFYNPATELQNQQESRRFILDRSVFDLVEAHVYLSLTDSRLLNWYLSLSPEDRQIVQAEGSFRQFLQRHPALEMTKRHVYVKYSTGGIRPVQPTVMSERSVKSGATTARCEPPHTHLELELFPRDLTLLGCRNTTGEHLCDEFCNSKQSLHLQESFHQTSSSPITERASLQKDLSSSAAVCRDPSVLAGLTLDLELDRCSQRPETRTHISAARDQNVTCSEARLSHSDWPTVNKEPSDFSSDRIRLDGSEYSDVNIVQTNSSSVGSEDRCQDDLLQRDQFTDEDQTENIHSIMEDDRSILVCCPSCLKSDHPQTTLNPSEFTCRPTCDVNVGTELLLRTSTFTQTEDPETVNKHVITEVHMSDLDYLAEEFTKLKTTQGQKEKIKREECDCTERGQKAELNLLMLQYNICRHHIWKLYWEGKQLSSVNKDPPENITEVLDKLDSDYQEMKREILAGVPLEQLKPLSVDSGMIISGGYTPAQMVADELGNVSSWTSEDPQQIYPAAERSRRPDDGSRNISQIKKKMIKTRRAASVILKDGRFLQTKQEGNQTAVGEEVSRSELWFDAEEDLELPEVGQNPAAEPADESVPEEGSVLRLSSLPGDVTMGDLMLLLKDYEASEVKISALKDNQRVAVVTVSGPQAAEAAVEELDGCRLKDHTLHVEHIRGNGNLQDLPRPGPSENLQDLPRPGPSENLQDLPRPGPSENLQDLPRPGPSENLQDLPRPGPSENLQDLPRPGPSENLQDLPRPGPSENLQDLPRPGPSENLQDLPRPGPSENQPSSPGRTPFISSTGSRKVVFISPTARGTCVPQHYGTMGSFDTLMSELLQRHPEVGRQKIADALVELRRKYPGVLTGLPLQTIREMTSQLLTRPETASQI